MDNRGEGLPRPIDPELSKQAVKDFVRQADGIVNLIEEYPDPKSTSSMNLLDEHTQLNKATPTGGVGNTDGIGSKQLPTL